MIWRSLLLAVSLLLTTLFQAGFISALPVPLSDIPLVFAMGVLLYHFVRPNIGAAWIIGAGVLLDLFSAPGAVHMLSFALAALIGVILSRRFFANRSLYATVSLGVCMYGFALLIEGVWMLSASHAHGRSLTMTELSAYFWTHVFVFVITLCLVFLFSRRGAHSLRRLFFIRT